MVRQPTNRHWRDHEPGTLPFGWRVTVTDLRNGRNTQVRINDRGPFIRSRWIHLSYGAAHALGIGGTARVLVE